MRDSLYLIDNQGRMVNTWVSKYEPITSYLITEITDDSNTRLKNGDMITINALTGELSVALSDDELAARQAAWAGPRETIYSSGALWKYAQLVGSTRLGAVTHPGAKHESHVYMDL